MQKERTPYRLYVLLAQTLLTLLLTYPLLFKLSTHLIGIAEDNLQSVWNLWWVKHSVLNLHTHPYHTEHLFYPLGTSLAFHTLSLFNSFLSIPLQFFLSRITCYNLLILLSFVLAGYGMYLLAYELTGHFGASFVASLVFAYSPYHFAHAGHHLQLSSIQFIPLYVLYLIRLFSQGKLKYSLFAGVFLVLASLCSWYYLMYLFIFSVIFVIYRLINFIPTRVLGKVFAMLLVWGMMISPFVYPLVKETVYGRDYISKDYQLWFSADLAAFIIPSPSHPLVAGSLDNLYGKLGGNPWEATVFLGFTVLLLAGYAIYKLRWHQTGFWVTSGVIFSVLSLGPRLHIMGNSIFPDTPMPYWLIHQFPLFRMISSPSRFVVMVMLSLAVLVGYAVKEIFSGEKKIKLGMGLIAGLILMEYATFPVDLVLPDQVTRAPFLQQVLAADESDYAVLELPIKGYWINNIYMYRQTKHHKKILNGNVSRHSPEFTKFISDEPLRRLAENTGITDDYFEQLKPLFVENKIKYIIFNKYLYGDTPTDKLSGLMDEAFDKAAKLKDEITVFKVY